MTKDESSQCIAMIQLTKEEAAQYEDCPVVLDFASGFYVFPVCRCSNLSWQLC
jgi:hypothetical protein